MYYKHKLYFAFQSKTMKVQLSQLKKQMYQLKKRWNVWNGDPARTDSKNHFGANLQEIYIKYNIRKREKAKLSDMQDVILHLMYLGLFVALKIAAVPLSNLD